jgi:hypothetical protein
MALVKLKIKAEPVEVDDQELGSLRGQNLLEEVLREGPPPDEPVRTPAVPPSRPQDPAGKPADPAAAKE